MQLCKICNKEFALVYNHIKNHNITSKEYYDKFIRVDPEEDICQMYGKLSGCKKYTKFRGINDGYAKFCSLRCSKNSEKSKEKTKNTCMEKYGVSNPSCIPELAKSRGEKLRNRTEEEKTKTYEKKKMTYLKNCGETHPSKTKEFQQKSKETNLEKYGHVCSLHSPSVREKVKETNLRVRGVEDHMQDPTCREKIGKTRSKNRYPIIKKVLREKYNLELVNEEFPNNSIPIQVRCILCGAVYEQTFFNIYQGPSLCGICFPKTTSNLQKEIREFLQSHNIFLIENIRTLIRNRTTNHPLEIDLYAPHENIAIEVNGLYHHCEKFSGKDYHKLKTDLCKEKEIRLIHIFEDEWAVKQEIVKARLLHIFKRSTSSRIHARKCTIQEIDPITKNEFLNRFHIQGEDRSKIKLGAFYKNKLVAVMTFSMGNISKGSKRKDGEWELNRFCTNHNYHIPGIANKLLSYFKKNFEWKKIFSYADIRWSTGGVYTKMGFDLINTTPPNYWYLKDCRRIHRFVYRKTKEDPKDIPEHILRAQQGLDRIWDCGNYKYEISH